MKKTITIIFLLITAFMTGCFYVKDVSDEYFYINLEIDGESWNMNSIS